MPRTHGARITPLNETENLPGLAEYYVHLFADALPPRHLGALHQLPLGNRALDCGLDLRLGFRQHGQ